MSKILKPATHAEIAARAFAIYEAEGKPDGRDEIHWQRAYVELNAGEVVMAKPAATDITLIDGVGPVLEGKLKAAGFATLADIAGLSVAAMEKLDADLGLKGRSLREDWIAQAKDLVAGGTPRAKVDQKKAAKV